MYKRQRVIRTNYSNPPTHGGTIVSTVLNSPELFAMWEEELGAMRDRIRLMRKQLVEKIKEHGGKQDFSFVLEQRGMFSMCIRDSPWARPRSRRPRGSSRGEAVRSVSA